MGASESQPQDNLRRYRNVSSGNGESASSGPAAPIAAAAAANDTDAAKSLLALGIYDVDAPSASGGETALHIACRHNNAALVGLLLDAGADANARDAQGFTVLNHAMLGGSYCDDDARKNTGTPDRATAEANTRAILVELLEAGADPTAMAADGTSMLHAAVSGHLFTLGQQLLNRYRLSLPVATRALSGETLLHALVAGLITHVTQSYTNHAEATALTDHGLVFFEDVLLQHLFCLVHLESWWQVHQFVSQPLLRDDEPRDVMAAVVAVHPWNREPPALKLDTQWDPLFRDRQKLLGSFQYSERLSVAMRGAVGMGCLRRSVYARCRKVRKSTGASSPSSPRHRDSVIGADDATAPNSPTAGDIAIPSPTTRSGNVSRTTSTAAGPSPLRGRGDDAASVPVVVEMAAFPGVDFSPADVMTRERRLALSVARLRQLSATTAFALNAFAEGSVHSEKLISLTEASVLYQAVARISVLLCGIDAEPDSDMEAAIRVLTDVSSRSKRWSHAPQAVPAARQGDVSTIVHTLASLSASLFYPKNWCVPGATPPAFSSLHTDVDLTRHVLRSFATSRPSTASGHPQPPTQTLRAKREKRRRDNSYSSRASRTPALLGPTHTASLRKNNTLFSESYLGGNGAAPNLQFSTARERRVADPDRDQFATRVLCPVEADAALSEIEAIYPLDSLWVPGRPRRPEDLPLLFHCPYVAPDPAHLLVLRGYYGPSPARALNLVEGLRDPLPRAVRLAQARHHAAVTILDTSGSFHHNVVDPLSTALTLPGIFGLGAHESAMAHEREQLRDTARDILRTQILAGRERRPGEERPAIWPLADAAGDPWILFHETGTTADAAVALADSTPAVGASEDALLALRRYVHAGPRTMLHLHRIAKGLEERRQRQARTFMASRGEGAAVIERTVSRVGSPSSPSGSRFVSPVPSVRGVGGDMQELKVTANFESLIAEAAAMPDLTVLRPPLIDATRRDEYYFRARGIEALRRPLVWPHGPLGQRLLHSQPSGSPHTPPPSGTTAGRSGSGDNHRSGLLLLAAAEVTELTRCALACIKAIFMRGTPPPRRRVDGRRTTVVADRRHGVLPHPPLRAVHIPLIPPADTKTDSPAVDTTLPAKVFPSLNTVWGTPRLDLLQRGLAGRVPGAEVDLGPHAAEYAAALQWVDSDDENHASPDDVGDTDERLQVTRADIGLKPTYRHAFYTTAVHHELLQRLLAVFSADHERGPVLQTPSVVAPALKSLLLGLTDPSGVGGEDLAEWPFVTSGDGSGRPSQRGGPSPFAVDATSLHEIAATMTASVLSGQLNSDPRYVLPAQLRTRFTAAMPAPRDDSGLQASSWPTSYLPSPVRLPQPPPWDVEDGTAELREGVAHRPPPLPPRSAAPLRPDLYDACRASATALTPVTVCEELWSCVFKAAYEAACEMLTRLEQSTAAVLATETSPPGMPSEGPAATPTAGRCDSTYRVAVFDLVQTLAQAVTCARLILLTLLPTDHPFAAWARVYLPSAGEYDTLPDQGDDDSTVAGNAVTRAAGLTSISSISGEVSAAVTVLPVAVSPPPAVFGGLAVDRAEHLSRTMMMPPYLPLHAAQRQEWFREVAFLQEELHKERERKRSLIQSQRLDPVTGGTGAGTAGASFAQPAKSEALRYNCLLALLERVLWRLTIAASPPPATTPSVAGAVVSPRSDLTGLAVDLMPAGNAPAAQTLVARWAAAALGSSVFPRTVDTAPAPIVHAPPAYGPLGSRPATSAWRRAQNAASTAPTAASAAVPPTAALLQSSFAVRARRPMAVCAGTPPAAVGVGGPASAAVHDPLQQIRDFGLSVVMVPIATPKKAPRSRSNTPQAAPQTAPQTTGGGATSTAPAAPTTATAAAVVAPTSGASAAAVPASTGASGGANPPRPRRSRTGTPAAKTGAGANGDVQQAVLCSRDLFVANSATNFLVLFPRLVAQEGVEMPLLATELSLLRTCAGAPTGEAKRFADAPSEYFYEPRIDHRDAEGAVAALCDGLLASYVMSIQRHRGPKRLAVLPWAPGGSASVLAPEGGGWWSGGDEASSRCTTEPVLDTFSPHFGRVFLIPTFVHAFTTWEAHAALWATQRTHACLSREWAAAVGDAPQATNDASRRPSQDTVGGRPLTPAAAASAPRPQLRRDFLSECVSVLAATVADDGSVVRGAANGHGSLSVALSPQVLREGASSFPCHTQPDMRAAAFATPPLPRATTTAAVGGPPQSAFWQADVPSPLVALSLGHRYVPPRGIATGSTGTSTSTAMTFGSGAPGAALSASLLRHPPLPKAQQRAAVVSSGGLGGGGSVADTSATTGQARRVYFADGGPSVQSVVGRPASGTATTAAVSGVGAVTGGGDGVGYGVLPAGEGRRWAAVADARRCYVRERAYLRFMASVTLDPTSPAAQLLFGGAPLHVKMAAAPASPANVLAMNPALWRDPRRAPLHLCCEGRRVVVMAVDAVDGPRQHAYRKAWLGPMPAAVAVGFAPAVDLVGSDPQQAASLVAASAAAGAAQTKTASRRAQARATSPKDTAASKGQASPASATSAAGAAASARSRSTSPAAASGVAGPKRRVGKPVKLRESASMAAEASAHARPTWHPLPSDAIVDEGVAILPLLAGPDGGSAAGAVIVDAGDMGDYRPDPTVPDGGETLLHSCCILSRRVTQSKRLASPALLLLQVRANHLLSEELLV